MRRWEISLVVLFGCTHPTSGALAVVADSGGPAVGVSDAAAPTPTATASAPPGDAGSADDGGLSIAEMDAGPPAPCPPDMALIGTTCVDRFEAHLVSLGPDGAVVPFPHNERPHAGVRYEARSEPGVFPQGYMSRVESSLACKNASKRLCSMREWRRACQGRASTTYPYGQKLKKGKCNSERPHLLAIRFGADARAWKYEQFNDPALLAEPGYLAKTGEFEGCTSRDGLSDLVGNLHEWVSDTVDAEFMDRLNAEEVERKDQPWKEGNGVFMGGFFSTSDQHGPGCTFTTVAHEPTYHDYSIGFRCCEDANLPKPPKKKRKPTRE